MACHAMLEIAVKNIIRWFEPPITRMHVYLFAWVCTCVWLCVPLRISRDYMYSNAQTEETIFEFLACWRGGELHSRILVSTVFGSWSTKQPPADSRNRWFMLSNANDPYQVYKLTATSLTDVNIRWKKKTKQADHWTQPTKAENPNTENNMKNEIK